MIKQKLLATTALVSLVAGSAFAGGPAPSMHNDMSVKIGGMYDAKLIARDVKHDKTRFLTKNNKNTAIDTNAEIFIEAKNSTAKGLEYGAHVGLRTNTVSSKQPQSGMDRSWLWMEHADMGRVEFGSNNDVTESMRIGADRVATATGGISGDWFKLLNQEAFGANLSMDEFTFKPWNVGDNQLDLTLDATADNDHVEKARKINYYSPKINGFQVGVSYVSDAANKGSASAMPNTDAAVGAAADNYNVISAGLSWDGKIANDVMTSVSANYMGGSTRKGYTAVDSKKLSAFDIGGMISYNKLKASVSYGYTGKTGYQKTTTGLGVKAGWYATAGASYEFDKLVTSLTYFHGNKNKNESNILSLGADYHLASGIMPYAEITHYKAHLQREGGLALPVTSGESGLSIVKAADNTNKKTDGTMFIIGTKLSF